MRQTRWPAFLCLLLATALTIFAAARSPAGEASGSSPPSQTLEDGTAHYEEAPPVRVISLSDLDPVNTGAADSSLGGSTGGLVPVDESAMGSVLAECTLQDHTIIRLYAAAEGLIDGVFSRPGGGWTRFVRLSCGGDAAIENPTLTRFDQLLGQHGFLLRYASARTGTYCWNYYWFDGEAGLQVLTAYQDPVALDLDGDGSAELAWGVGSGGMSFYCRSGDGAVYQVTPSDYIENVQSLAAVEEEGPGPVRLIYRCGGGDRFCAVTLQDGMLEIEPDIAYVPASLEDAVPLPDIFPQQASWSHVSITAPDGFCLDGSGEAALSDIRSLLWSSAPLDAVIVPTDAPLDTESAYTVTFSSSAGGSAFSWSLDREGVCCFAGAEGNYRLICSGSGSLPAYCHDVLELYCDSGRTSRNYDASGRYLGWDLTDRAAGA